MNLALFDFDGTITSADTFTPFIYYATSKPRQVLGTAVLAPALLAHRLRMLRATHMRQAAAVAAFAGAKLETLHELGARYARDTLPNVMRKSSLERIRFHREQGDTIALVSASLDLYLLPWAEPLGLQVISTRLEVRGGYCSGRYLEGDCTGPEKARRVRRQFDLQRFETVYAYGDTREDFPLLELATKRFFRGQDVSAHAGPTEELLSLEYQALE
ncbi:MAG TPA: HAD-IB family hydrolase [Polyangiaceae bacterium]|jgi:HAD superfamily hydrolase (TIGR01490 family)|nr:HAD-IB family hydrolase [Polyangiaceae bacterium]